MKIRKSSRHAKITGDFSEALVAYWLSKYGFECSRIDHTGIDIIATNPNTGERMGISVKSRSRTEGKGGDSMNIGNKNFDKAKAACSIFGLKPYFGIVIDAEGIIRVFILPMKRLLNISPKGKAVSSWKMSAVDLKRYQRDPEITIVEIGGAKIKKGRWWTKTTTRSIPRTEANS